MLLAKQSTEIAQQHQDGRAAEQAAGRKDFAVQRHDVEIEIDPHQRNMMLIAGHRYVIPVTEERRRSRWNRGDRTVFSK
jgi:hypothetical protein